jgi:hypothetical protein
MKSHLVELKAGLRRHFGASTVSFVDPALLMGGCVSLDILRLDDWLQAQHPDYTDGESMAEAIARLYGQAAVAFCKQWIKGKEQHED